MERILEIWWVVYPSLFRYRIILDLVSKMIRYLHKEGFNTHAISKVLGIKYQHAYNVLHTIQKS